MTIQIDCPGCSGEGKFNTINSLCTYCNGEKKVALVKHLKVLKEHQKLSNVEHFQRRMSKSKTKQLES